MMMTVGRLGLPVRLGMERGGHVQLRAQQAHQFTPERGGEDRVVVRHQGLRDAVKANNVGEERLGDRLGGVRVCEWNEVAVFAEAINHGQDDRLPANTR